MLESRFDDLAHNHAEMIKFKDYHKTSATELKIENEELRERNSTLFSPEVEIRDREIEKWKAKNQQLFDEVGRLSALNTDLEAKNGELESVNLTNSATIEDLSKKLREKVAENDELRQREEKTVKELKWKHIKDTDELEKENKKLIQLSLSRGKEIYLPRMRRSRSFNLN